MPKATPLENVLARRFRELRDERELRQDDIAAAAQEHGLAWSQSIVASIETGRRALTATELLLLPLVLGCRLEELLCVDDEVVEVRPGIRIKCDGLRSLLVDDFRQPDVVKVTMPRGRRPGVKLGPVTEDVRRLARHFGATHSQVRVAAYNRFRRPLRDERDDRVNRLLAQRGEQDPSDRRVRALRGRVMRELMMELAPLLTVPEAPETEPTKEELARAYVALEEVARMEGQE